MKVFRNITISTGVIWLLCFLTVLISKNKNLDETMMALSILSSYLFVLSGVSFLITCIVRKIKNKMSNNS